jgi:hypothetical protein
MTCSPYVAPSLQARASQAAAKRKCLQRVYVNLPDAFPMEPFHADGNSAPTRVTITSTCHQADVGTVVTRVLQLRMQLIPRAEALSMAKMTSAPWQGRR